MATTAVDFQKDYYYCELCRSNHNQGYKHVYSKKHLSTLKHILAKFTKKMKEAKLVLKSPVVEALGFESSLKWWCYFCGCDVDKHSQGCSTTVIKLGSFIEHLASAEHRLKTESFWRTNKIKTEEKEKYLISCSEHERFKILAEAADETYAARSRHALNLEAQRITRVEEDRNRILETHTVELARKQVWMDRMKNTSGTESTGVVKGLRTLTAHGEGLTFIGQQEYDSSSRNIHSGGIPPWSRDDHGSGNSTTGGSIGPTAEDLDKHLKQEKKKKLPPNRVGAGNTSSVSSGIMGQMWLPSFGGVWNRGRRLNSKQQFLKRHGKFYSNDTTKRRKPTNQ